MFRKFGLSAHDIQLILLYFKHFSESNIDETKKKKLLLHFPIIIKSQLQIFIITYRRIGTFSWNFRTVINIFFEASWQPQVWYLKHLSHVQMGDFVMSLECNEQVSLKKIIHSSFQFPALYEVETGYGDTLVKWKWSKIS